MKKLSCFLCQVHTGHRNDAEKGWPPKNALHLNQMYFREGFLSETTIDGTADADA